MGRVTPPICNFFFNKSFAHRNYFLQFLNIYTFENPSYYGNPSLELKCLTMSIFLQRQGLTVTHSWRVFVSHFCTALGTHVVVLHGTVTSTRSTRSYLKVFVSVGNSSTCSRSQVVAVQDAASAVQSDYHRH